jgi:hypothetical protein
MKTSQPALSTLYDRDFYLWLDTTAKLLKGRCFEELDLENLIEEIESIGRSEKRELKSRLITLVEHLLQLKHWESERVYNERGWRNTIIEQRHQVKLTLEDSPSLKQVIPSLFPDCYQNAREIFLQKSDLPAEIVPVVSPFTPEEVLNSNYFLKDE